MDAVLDTNVVISSLISISGPPVDILDAWRERSFVWVTSEELIRELERVLERPHVRKYVRSDEGEEFLRLIRQLARIVLPAQRIDFLTVDPDDNRVLEAAVEGKADYIVSGDSDLLDLREFRGVAIVTPARFAAMVAERA